MEDRAYQFEATAAIEKGLDEGIHQQLLSMATGTGKTVVFTKLYEQLKGRLPGQMLILAHREELIDQARTKMQDINPNLKVDKEMAEHKADPSTAHVVVASVATLGRKGNTRLAKYNWDNFDKLICDEAHHSVADSYRFIFDNAGVLRPSYNGLLLGVTATPNRGDGKALAEIYKKVVYTYTLRQAIEDGWLVDVRGVRVYTKTSLDGVKTVAGDFNQEMLAEAVGTPYRNKLIVDTWLQKGENRQTIVFAADIKHAQDLAKEFQDAGVMAEAVWGDDTDRATKLQMHRDKILQVIVNVGVLTEGYDDWQIGCVVLGRPTKSPVLFAQMIGRGTRLQEGTGNLKSPNAPPILEPFLKKDCIVIDVVDATQHHSLVTLPTLFGMSSKLDTNGVGMAWAIQAIEAAQANHPEIDFSNLTDLEKINSYIEDVNLFTVKFPPEVEEMSNLTWHAAVDGGFILALNTSTKLRFKIKQNLLDKWEISGNIDDDKFKGERDGLEEAFTAVEQVITKRVASDVLNLLNRKAAWFSKPASKPQLDLLQKFYKGKTPPPNLTKGQASVLISAFIAKKAK